MGEPSKNIKDGWGEYAHTILTKLEELHKDNKQTQRDIAEIKLAIVKLEINKEEVGKLNGWKDEVSDVWSPKNMEAAHKEIYVQKGRWSVVWGVIIGLQVVWTIIIAYLNTKK